ncbi:MAG: chromosome partitioning ATPase, partial [Oxalobacteraceae bacterium]
MSIIEKAASRIDQQRSAAASATGTATVPDSDAARAIPPVAAAAPPA